MAEAGRRQLAVYSAGFWRQKHQRRILQLAGWEMAPLGWPARADAIGVWGRRPASLRGRAIAAIAGKPVLTVEDGFLRSLHPGSAIASPVGLLLDRTGVCFDASGPSDLENILNEGAPDDPDLLVRARAGWAFLRENGLSKYNPVPRGHGELPPPGYVLVIDQRRGDASIRAGGANMDSFRRMLEAAIADNPGREILIRAHPHGQRGHFDRQDDRPGARVLRDPANPWDLLEGAHAVYCVTSQLGFEAILAGHRPHVFGLPFYAGWGLSEDRQRCTRRHRRLCSDALFAGVMLRYPVWYDPIADRLCEFEQAAGVLRDHAHIAWKTMHPAVCTGFRRWKYPHMRQFLQGSDVPPRFAANPHKALRLAASGSRRLHVWASREPRGLAAAAAAKNIPVVRVEDGFLRSVGLGADLRPPHSLIFDDTGIHYDPSKPSHLETLIADAAVLPPEALARAAHLRARIVDAGVTKYNLPPGARSDINPGARPMILVAGQVEDDASVAHVGPALGGNAGLLAAARAAWPGACLLYKPHPDVEAGLRKGHVSAGVSARLADRVVADISAASLIPLVEEVWTMSSLLGFEALLRGCKVVCLGMPFYAGWGLTEDRGTTCARRVARPSLDALVHAALIEYPIYLDPRSGLFTTPERIVNLLSGQADGALGATAALQRRAAPLAGLWRGRPLAEHIRPDDAL